MSRLTSPEKHFTSKEIQSHVRGYIGCPVATENAQACRSSITTNRFTDPVTNKKFNCNWYCLRNCSPEKLMPIFKNVPQYALSNNGEHLPIDLVTFVFKTPTEQIVINIDDNKTESWDWDNIASSRGQYFQQTGFTKLAEQLCGWFRQQDPNIKISAKCSVVLKIMNENKDPDEIRELGFGGFDKPFFLPTSKWINDGEIITTKLMVLNKTASPAKQRVRQDIVWSEQLPIGLAEEEPLVYRGVAHPRLHHIPRQYRPESRHRPRHFHSPVRGKRSRGARK